MRAGQGFAGGSATARPCRHSAGTAARRCATTGTRGAAQLDPLADVLIAVGGEEEPQTALHQLILLEVLAHADHIGEVVRARGNRRFTDLERGEWSWPFSLFQYEQLTDKTSESCPAKAR